MELRELTYLGVAIAIAGAIIGFFNWCFPYVELIWKLTMGGITVFALLLIFLRRFRVILQRRRQEVLCFLLLGVVLWFLFIKFPTFLLPSILIMFASVAVAMLLFTKHIPPQYKKEDKYKEQDRIVIFNDDFDSPEHWSLNHWRSNYCSISDGKMRLACSGAPRGEDGSHRDLIDKLEVGGAYQITCHLKAELGTTGKFRLWCHDKCRPDAGNLPEGVSISTTFKTPAPDGASVSLLYIAVNNPHIRIHLQYRPGRGAIYVDNVRIYKILEIISQ